MGYWRLLVPFALTFFITLHSSGQAVISVHSGVVQFSEGSVFIDDQALDQKFGSFPNVKEGSTLRTEQGRAEILLTPGVFLRVDQHSSVRMLSSALTDTKIEFLQGSVILDSTDSNSDKPATLVYKDSQICFPKPGTYRVDFEPALLQVYSGEAEVIREGKHITVDPSHLYFLSAGLDTRKVGDGVGDDFYQWSNSRNQAVTADNQLAARTPDDPSAADSNSGDDNDDALSALGPVAPTAPRMGSTLPDYSPLGSNPGNTSPLFNPYTPFSSTLSPFAYSTYGYGVYPMATVIPIPIYGLGYRLQRWPRTVIPSYSPVRVGVPIHSPYRPIYPTRSIGTVGSGFVHPVPHVSISAPVHPVSAPHLAGHAIGHR
jgi:hypothetical protein